MKLVTVSDLFDIIYGVNLELILLEQCEQSEGYPFVSRTAGNNGVSAYVLPMKDITPNPAHTISVAVGGSVMESFYQKEPYYTGYHVLVLTPKEPMTEQEMLFYCTCLRANKYKYNYGRQANSTLKYILIPDRSEIPEWVYTTTIESPTDKPILSQETPKLDTSTWKEFRYDEIFDISRGKLSSIGELSVGNTDIVTATEKNNGISYSLQIEQKYIKKNNCITVSNNGSIAESFYQNSEFSATSDINILILKNKTINSFIAMFLNTVIHTEKYRYNYGRKWGLDRMKESIIKLPVDSNGQPDWDYMENYIKTLKYSSSI